MIYLGAMAKKQNKKPRGVHIFLARFVGKVLRPWVSLSRKFKIAIISLIIFALLYQFKGIFFVATVNGEPIGRIQVLKELERSQGKTVLDGLITESLISQAAQKQGIKISDVVVEEELKKIEESISSQGQNLNDILELQGISISDLKKDIEFQKIIEQLVADQITVTDEETATYKVENKDYLQEGVTDDEVRAQIVRQKVSEAFQEWITKAKEEAKINYWKEY
ncbi:MAG: Parvulin-like protein peptidyl-prolyl isomerase [Candidatus Woesebacteria bacterium GW2011_GWB1_43_14]|uniref:Parvulin-like protein peptidyl-prolyl isomerase n=1 Tax=Candidatus Woesebacteria bacterium GW2011_GWB1_43_14 TaxID=1618578 RepID=A0A0G1DIC9_9BACT|nr:MAG: Parvulin-like protein peptidyl-prolyl isomerase [Candidatus Woesebacteria bacterium GW2011_GWA1_39_11b]KKS78083.1 MAG: Parvulin-like protein peptidyl-prolyl isomerase [Candidatus Woesebacteria bacterium GW2011_GWC1_42_9]KKS97337.1 MAG: Parvulin-like protein peptidyl-prolyl isomerase [Candidatus Woesebacteria bacterium GW2011_GWB1_43_14]